MSSYQQDLFVHLFKSVNGLDKFFAVKILEQLVIKAELHIEEIYLIFGNHRKKTVRKILSLLEENHLVFSNDSGNKKIYQITKSGEELVIQSYSNYPYL
ncbi:hypothetical protein [Vallitalea okinawensis]|uniref:hypothetical protein n=1 Tax=Vallitalea okinawensis TaxID=2078660 RepID=UPI000CFD61DA|nr:hypothetical protein [Vallitalea okinawensis]